MCPQNVLYANNKLIILLCVTMTTFGAFPLELLFDVGFDVPKILTPYISEGEGFTIFIYFFLDFIHRVSVVTI